MARLYGIPQAAVGVVRSLWAGPLGETLWKVALVTLYLLTLVALAALSWPLASVLLGLLAVIVIRPTLRRILLDFWNRNWAEL